jgi:hypothetical protein
VLLDDEPLPFETSGLDLSMTGVERNGRESCQRWLRGRIEAFTGEQQGLLALTVAGWNQPKRPVM